MLPALLGLMAPVVAVRALTQLARAAGAALRSATARVALPVPTNAEKAAEGFFDNSDSPVIFAYDGYGRRIKIAEFDNGNLTSKKLYWWLGGEIVCERDGIDPAFPILKRYFGQGVQVGGTNLYYTFDQLGSVRELVDSSGVVRSDYRYTPYGERTKVGGDLDSDWGYAGLFHHAPSGLDLATYRTYDSKAGRWISRDPLGEGVDYNLYRYCGNNPINCTDPSGLDANLSIVVVEGGTYNALGHSWLEVTPIAGTGSNWSETTSYGSYPDGLKVNADLTSGYGPGTERVRVTIRLNAGQEKAFLKWKKEAEKKKWTPKNNCAPFSISGWNEVAPEANDINSADAQERVSPDLVSDPKAKQALRLHKIATGKYPLEVTPRQLGKHLATIPGHTNQ